MDFFANCSVSKDETSNNDFLQDKLKNVLCHIAVSDAHSLNHPCYLTFQKHMNSCFYILL